MQIYGESLYMHQFKINGKMAFDGDVWQWHQDYGTWVNDDLMPEPRGADNNCAPTPTALACMLPLIFCPAAGTRRAAPA